MTLSDLLVVDDDDSTRTGLRHLLVNAGFTVDVARDGAEALNKIIKQEFGVVRSMFDYQDRRVGDLISL